MTAIPTKGPLPQPRAGGASMTSTAGAASSFVPVDPIKLLRQYLLLFIAAGATSIVVGVGAFFVLRQYSPVFRTNVVYQVLPIERPPTERSEGQDREEFERFAATEARVITSERILRNAIRSGQTMRDNAVWMRSFKSNTGAIDEPEALRDLKERAGARVVAGTQFVELTVSTNVRDDAALIADAIHSAYFDDLRQRTSRASTEGKDALSRERTAIQSRLDSNEAATRKLISENQLTGTLETSSDGRNQIEVLQPQIADTSQQIERLRAEVRSLEGQVSADGVVAYSKEQVELADRDPIVSGLRERISSLRSEDAALARMGQGENHRDRALLRERLASAQSELDAERESALKKLYDADLDRARQGIRRAEAALADLNTRLETARTRENAAALARAQIEVLQSDRANLNLELTRVQRALGDVEQIEQMWREGRVGRVRLVEAPSRPDTMAFPRLSVIVPLSVIVIMGLTVGVVVLREVLDLRIRGASDIALIPRLRLAGVVPIASEDPSNPKDVETAYRDAPTGAISESYRLIRAMVSKRLGEHSHKSLLVLGGAPGAGATTTAVNLAMGFAGSEQRVLLVDANFRRPALHKVLKLAEGPGLSDVLVRSCEIEQAIQPTSTPGLDLLSAGIRDQRVPERLSGEQMTRVLREAAAKYDMVIIDTAPGMIAGDGVALANRSDATLMVVRAMGEKRGLVARLRDQLADTRTDFLGVVVTCVRSSTGGYMRKNIKASYEYQNADNG